MFALFSIIVIFVLYAVVIALIVIVRRKRRKTRWPFKDSDKLLRGPGESLRRKIQQLDDDAPLEFIGMLLAVITVATGVLHLVQRFHATAWVTIAVTLGATVIVVIVGAVRMVRKLSERTNWYLGWYGERMAADHLRPLQRQGYHVFHDVPGEPGKKGFNIDHVVVGPTGVTAVEVKTRRKGNARPGREDHVVTFDGRQLSWPWGEDRQEIDQAVAEADWLRKWIESRTGLKVPVRPILTLPGWWVNEAPSAALRVVNPKVLPDAVRGRWPVALSAEQVDLIARQLEIICRDVED